MGTVLSSDAGKTKAKWACATTAKTGGRGRPRKPYYTENLEEDTRQNTYFRKVVYTSPFMMQMVFMSLAPGEDIGSETHAGTDQFIRAEAGTGYAEINGERYRLSDGSAVIIPAGARHNIVNDSADEPLQLYNIYAPAEHKPQTLHPTKAAAGRAERAAAASQGKAEENRRAAAGATAQTKITPDSQ